MGSVRHVSLGRQMVRFLWHRCYAVYCFGLVTYGDVCDEMIANSKMKTKAWSRHQAIEVPLLAIPFPLASGDGRLGLEGDF